MRELVERCYRLCLRSAGSPPTGAGQRRGDARRGRIAAAASGATGCGTAFEIELRMRTGWPFWSTAAMLTLVPAGAVNQVVTPPSLRSIRITPNGAFAVPASPGGASFCRLP
jgi:hypothetical protein